MKAKYRHLTVKRIIRAIVRNGSVPTTSILDDMFVRSWDAVEEKTVVNCFRKAGINPDTQTSAMNDDDDPFREIEVESDPLLIYNTIWTSCGNLTQSWFPMT